jgi:hypothetical protein
VSRSSWHSPYESVLLDVPNEVSNAAVHSRRPSWVKGCPRDDVGSASGVPQIAADSHHRLGWQPWARCGLFRCKNGRAICTRPAPAQVTHDLRLLRAGSWVSNDLLKLGGGSSFARTRRRQEVSPSRTSIRFVISTALFAASSVSNRAATFLSFPQHSIGGKWPTQYRSLQVFTHTVQWPFERTRRQSGQKTSMPPLK